MVVVFVTLVFGVVPCWGQTVGAGGGADILGAVQQMPAVIGAVQHRNAVAAPQACDASGRPILSTTPTLPERPHLRFRSVTPPVLNRELCNSFDPNTFCRNLPGPDSTLAALPVDQQERRSDVQLRQKIFSHLDRYFQELVTDPDILAACCQPAEPPIRCGDRCAQNRACQNRLAQTKLRILPSATLDDRTARYIQSTQHIEISESLVLNALHPEINERLLLHELGHACQFNRPRDIMHTIVLDHFTDHCDDDADSWADLQELLPEVARCLRAPLLQSALSWRGPNQQRACRNAWAVEAFADAIFAFRRVNPNAWIWDCNGFPDALHGPPNMHMACIIPRAPAATDVPRPRLWDQYCNRPQRNIR